MELIERLNEAHQNSQQRVLGSDIFKEAADTIERLLDFSAAAGVAYRDDNSDLIIEGFRALPDEVQQAINEREEKIDNA